MKRNDLEAQRDYWNAETDRFDSIYSQAKGKLAVVLDKTFRRDMYERFAYTLDNAQPIEGRSFLDVGCGTGRYALELARYNAEHVVGIDISERMIEVCRERAREEGLAARTSFVRSDLLNFEPAGSFDVCLGIGLFDYIRDPLPVLAKMREVTRYAAILSFPRRWTWRAPLRKSRLAVKGCYVRFYSLREVSELLDSAGFVEVDHSTVGKLYCVTAFSNGHPHG
jgi:ubiquinone/menaquinone biosynthesis C-methylase UbiE